MSSQTVKLESLRHYKL